MQLTLSTSHLYPCLSHSPAKSTFRHPSSAINVREIQVHQIKQILTKKNKTKGDLQSKYEYFFSLAYCLHEVIDPLYFAAVFPETQGQKCSAKVYNKKSTTNII